MMARTSLALAVGLGPALHLTTVQAQPLAGHFTRSASFMVSVVIDSDCLISHADNLDFGHAAGSPSRLWQARQLARLSVACSSNTQYLLYLDRGDTAGSSVDHRLMAGGSPGNRDRLQYQLYLDAACSSVWGDGTSGSAGNVSGIGSGTVQTYPVYGLILRQDRPNTDRYGSVVTASLTF